MQPTFKLYPCNGTKIHTYPILRLVWPMLAPMLHESLLKFIIPARPFGIFTTNKTSQWRIENRLQRMREDMLHLLFPPLQLV